MTIIIVSPFPTWARIEYLAARVKAAAMLQRRQDAAQLAAYIERRARRRKRGSGYTLEHRRKR